MKFYIMLFVEKYRFWFRRTLCNMNHIKHLIQIELISVNKTAYKNVFTV